MMKHLLLVLLLASPLLRAADYTPGEFGSLPILLGVETVRTKLDITQSQAAQLNEIRNDYRTRARSIASENLSDAADRKLAEAALAKLTTSTNQQALGVLTDSQKVELVKMEHRFLGATLLHSPAIQQHLGITPGQRARLAEAREDALTKGGSINRKFEDGKISFNTRLVEWRATRQAAAKKALSILTPSQRKAFEKLGD